MYLVTLVNDNLDETHYFADTAEDGKKFLLKTYFEGDTEYMEDCRRKDYPDDTLQVWRDEEGDHTLVVELVEKITI